MPLKTAGFGIKDHLKRLEQAAPALDDSDPSFVARAIADLAEAPPGSRAQACRKQALRYRDPSIRLRC
jgi:hypothetical protein